MKPWNLNQVFKTCTGKKRYSMRHLNRVQYSYRAGKALPRNQCSRILNSVYIQYRPAYCGIEETHMQSISRRGIHTQCLGSGSISLPLQWWSHLVFWHKIPCAGVKTDYSLQRLLREARASLVFFSTKPYFQQSQKRQQGSASYDVAHTCEFFCFFFFFLMSMVLVKKNTLSLVQERKNSNAFHTCQSKIRFQTWSLWGHSSSERCRPWDCKLACFSGPFIWLTLRNTSKPPQAHRFQAVPDLPFPCVGSFQILAP